jgi:hypothetical protein
MEQIILKIMLREDVSRVYVRAVGFPLLSTSSISVGNHMWTKNVM